ncbi:MAG: PIG-L family deacetylase, partial [Rhodothermales bacterium]
MIRTSYFLLLTVFLTQGTLAQEAPEPLVVMNLAAHPDDEDGSTLAYYRHAKNAIAYSVIFTRGEGGQNEIGPELYEELGAIRTRETERAARHLGTQVFFLNFKDFGFSKSADETFERWGGRDEVTERIVYLIRKLKPDLLFTNHDTVTVGQNRQHGHHQAVGLSAYDAFDLASDPDYHPEHLSEEGVDLWQPKRMFRRLWSSGGEHQVAVPVGNIDAQSGLSYAEMAGRALHEHSSQGMEMFAGRIGEWKETYFVLYRSATNAPLSDTDLSANLPQNRDASPHFSYWIDSGRLASLPPNTISATDSIRIAGKTVRVNWKPEHLPQKPVRIRFFGAVDTSIVVRDDSPPYANLRIRGDFAPTVPKKVFQYEHFTNHLPIGYALSNPRESELLSGGYLNVEIAPPIYLEADAEVSRLRGGENSVSYSVRVYDPAIQDVIVSAAVSRDTDRQIVDQQQETIRGGSKRSTSLSLP